METGPAAACVALERIREQAQGSLHGATLSIGYVNLELGETEHDPFVLADFALYEAKRRGRNTVIDFAQLGDKSVVHSSKKAAAIRRLIDERLVNIAFQPIWDVQSHRPLGFEALARPHPELGLAGPAEAFDLAEKLRLVPELDCVCARKAFEAAENLPAGATLFVNISPATVEHHSFDPQSFLNMVIAAGLRPEQVVLELTERRITDPQALVIRANMLIDIGFRLALDDTGAGQAGLETLSTLRLAFVKIDRMLLVKAVDDKIARGVLAGILAIARETGSYLIAEGIESVTLLAFARSAHVLSAPTSLGIRGMQGYLLGMPEIGKVDIAQLKRYSEFLTDEELRVAV